MKRGKAIAFICTAAMISAFVSGCIGKEPVKKADSKGTLEMVSNKQLATDIQEKYQDKEKYEYEKPIRDVARDESLFVDVDFDIKASGYENYTDIAAVYQDPELTQRVGTHFGWNEEDKIMEITPPRWSVAGLGASEDLIQNQEDLLYGYDKVSTTLFDKEELKDWGNLKQYYMARFVDEKTGEKLEKPVITPFTVKHEIERTPNLKFNVNENGEAEFSWNKIEGAKAYYLVEYSYAPEKGYDMIGLIKGATDKTSWSPDSHVMFHTFSVSEADRNQEWVIEKYGEGTGPVVTENDMREYRYAVVAVNENGNSAISNSFSKHQIAKMVASYEEGKKSIEEEGSRYAESFEQLPSYRWVTMCDGRLVQKLIQYDIENAQEKKETWGEYENPDMSDLHNVEVEIVKIPYTIEGTPFTDVAVVENYKKETVKEDLKALQERQDALANRGGRTDAELIVEEEKDVPEEGTSEDDVYSSEYEVTANSALSAYLGANMMAGNEKIDLSAFNEAMDGNNLVDAWQEATYQNPLALGVKSASVSGKYMLVEYEQSKEEMLRKQKEIMKAVKDIVAEVITEDMTELEKEIALNDYLCEHAEYDMGALENAEKNNFKNVDKEFQDSFTPYGVLVKQVGVCASYAGAYKLLAEEAGLDCIVVTGYLDGSLPHAWNKVKVDGEWLIVDTTNNDNPYLFNALLNLPNNEADKVLVEDENYLMDAAISEYEAVQSEKEYYRISQKYYGEDQIAAALSTGLTQDGASTLRTEYSLNDEQFAAIAQQAAENSGSELKGTYWMGVIYLTK